MKVTVAARVLIASDDAHNAGQLVEELRGDHEQLLFSTVSANAGSDFEALRPDVVVLAFNGIDNAQRYYLALYRQSKLVNEHRYRTVLLCSQEEQQGAFDLCRQGVFDDYVLYGPLVRDGLRVRMSVWNAARDVRAGSGPSAQELVRHAEQLVAMDTLLKQHFTEGGAHVARASQTLQTAQSAIGAAIDAFSRQLMQPGGRGPVDVKDAAILSREIERLKSQGVALAFKGTSDGMASLASWSGSAQERLAPHMDGIRGFATKVSAARWTILVVEDDDFARKMLAKTLKDSAYELLFAKDGADALSVLRRTRPHLILMDVNLPDMDGVTLTRKLKEAPHLADIPIVMLTGQARREVIDNSRNAGAAGFVVKPYTRETLVAKIDDILLIRSKALPAGAAARS